VNKYEIVTPASYNVVPWRNGRGETLELCSHPLVDCNAFSWRLSIATVDNDGPFSRFVDCDRTLVLLEGAGISLRQETGKLDVLSSRFSIARFSGDCETEATLHNGAIRDFNVMCNRRHCSAIVDALSEDGSLFVSGDILFFYAVDRDVELRSPDCTNIGLKGNHILKFAGPAHGRWAFSHGPVIAIRIFLNPIASPAKA
jgi:environmental stress-induced protein Ves